MVGRFGTIFRDVKPVQGFLANRPGRQGIRQRDPLTISGSTDPEGMRIKKRLKVRSGN